jgi:hypothetical protein
MVLPILGRPYCRLWAAWEQGLVRWVSEGGLAREVRDSQNGGDPILISIG